MAVQPIPEGYNTLTPYLVVDDATGAIEFYGRALGAQERYRMPTPDGRVAHAELQIGDSVLMLSDPSEGSDTTTPKQAGTRTAGIFVYVEDVDAAFKRAVDAGATPVQEPEDMFWGDRFARVHDPYGHSWQFATHVEDVPAEEMERRSRELFAASASS